MIEWTPEKIAKLTVNEVKLIRDRAMKRSITSLVDLCNSDLERRAAEKKGSMRQTSQRQNQMANELHFVCRPQGKGVTLNPDGSAWTGTWVVAKKQAEHAVKVGASVALHLARAKPSYLQGIVIDWRIAERDPQYAEDRETKVKNGVDFRLKLTDQPLHWKGDATGEKGYGYDPSPNAEAPE